MQKIAVLAVAALILLMQGCVGTRARRDTHPDRRLTPEQQALAGTNCYGGIPRTSAPVGPTELVVRRGYALEHSSDDKIPLWVCESVDAQQLSGHLRRNAAFQPDPQLQGPKSYPRDYLGSGYDRGHQAPAGNQTQDRVLKDETFYMSNMAPQTPLLNRGLWRQLEEKTRRWVVRYGRAYEWTGPIRCDAHLRAAVQLQKNCHRNTLGDGVAIPVSFYKIILVSDGGDWKALAFVMPNVTIGCPCRLDSYLTSIDEIERETGLEFMPKVAPAVGRALKAQTSPLWK